MSDATYTRIEPKRASGGGDGAESTTPQPSVASDSVWTARAQRWQTALALEGQRLKPLVGDAALKTRVSMPSLRRHVAAVAALFVFGFVPLIIYFKTVATPFEPEPVTCKGPSYSVQGDYPTGIVAVFTIDRLAGAVPFWLAKFLDTVWDLVVARGMQFLASLLSYVVFSNALLRAIEASPIPYRTFIGIALNGASVGTVFALLMDLRRHSRARTTALFSYGALAFAYVLAMPTLFSAMTGYTSTSTGFIKVPDTEQFVPLESFSQTATTFFDLPGIRNGTCIPYDNVASARNRKKDQVTYCNSTCEIHAPYTDLNDVYGLSDECYFFRNETYRFSENTKSTSTGNWDSVIRTYNCNDTITLTIDGRQFPMADALAHSDYWGNYSSMSPDGSPYQFCYNSTPYTLVQYEANTRCLPDTDHAAYRWGFSATLTSVVLIVHAVWAASLYAVWLEAELSSRLLREGYGLTQLRAAFVLAAAAQETTGVEVDELKRRQASKVEQKLYGRDAAVGWELFARELPFADVAPYEET